MLLHPPSRKSIHPVRFLVDWDFGGAQFERSFTRWPLAVGNHEGDQLSETNPTTTFSGDRMPAWGAMLF